MRSNKAPAKLIEERLEVEHFRYRIVAGQRDGACQAVAYLGRRKIYTTGGETVDAAVAAVKRILDEHLVRLARERVDGVPSEAEFREALLVVDMALPEQVVRLLSAHSRCPGGAATLSDLARLSGWDEATVKLKYVQAGRQIANLLGFSPRPNKRERPFAPILTFAGLDLTDGSAAAILRLRPEVIAALAIAHPGSLIVQA